MITICLATSYKTYPMKMGDQNDLLLQGQTFLVSGKHNPVIISQTEKVVKNGDATFYFACANNENCPINLYFQNISVTDQWGRPIRVIKKEELIEKKKTKVRWKKFAAALFTGLEALGAQSAGDVKFRTNTSDIYHINGNSNGSLNIYGSSTTTGTIRNEAVRRKAMGEVGIRAQAKAAMLEG